MAAPLSISFGPIQLKWDEHSWDGACVLPCWKGFQERLGAYASASSDKPSSGEARLSVASGDGKKKTPPTTAQLKAFQFLLENQDVVQEKALQTFFAEYPKWKADWGFGADHEDMPDLKAPADFKNLMGLSIVHILNDEKDGLAYVGLEFGCTWDEEHGAGVLLHQAEVVAAGQADSAFDSSAAQQHNGTAKPEDPAKLQQMEKLLEAPKGVARLIRVWLMGIAAAFLGLKVSPGIHFDKSAWMLPLAMAGGLMTISMLIGAAIRPLKSRGKSPPKWLLMLLYPVLIYFTPKVAKDFRVDNFGWAFLASGIIQIFFLLVFALNLFLTYQYRKARLPRPSGSTNP